MSLLNLIWNSRRAMCWFLLVVAVVLFAIGYWCWQDIEAAIALPIVSIVIVATIVGVLMQIYESGRQKGREEERAEMVSQINEGKIEF